MKKNNKNIAKNVKRLLKNERERCNYNILIWGSGEYSAFDHKKRKLLRKKLEKCYKGKTIFPEDDEYKDLIEEEGITVVDGTLAKLATLVVALITGDGVKQEVCRYENSILGKAFLLVSDKYINETSYINESIFVVNTPYWYNHTLYEKCELKDSKTNKDLTTKCIHRINIQVSKIAEYTDFLLRNQPIR